MFDVSSQRAEPYVVKRNEIVREKKYDSTGPDIVAYRNWIKKCISRDIVQSSSISISINTNNELKWFPLNPALNAYTQQTAIKSIIFKELTPNGFKLICYCDTTIALIPGQHQPRHSTKPKNRPQNIFLERHQSFLHRVFFSTFRFISLPYPGRADTLWLSVLW